MTIEERKKKLEELRKEYKNGTRSKIAVELEAKLLKRSIEMVEGKHE